MDNAAPPPYTGLAPGYPAEKATADKAVGAPPAPAQSAPAQAAGLQPTVAFGELQPVHPEISLFPGMVTATQATLQLVSDFLSVSGGDFNILRSGAPLLHARGATLKLKGRIRRELVALRVEKARQLLGRPTWIAEAGGREVVALRSLHAWTSTEMEIVVAGGLTLTLKGAPDQAVLALGEQVVASFNRVPKPSGFSYAYAVAIAPGVDMALVAMVGICFHVVTGGVA